jgi:hypothetical protein
MKLWKLSYEDPEANKLGYKFLEGLDISNINNYINSSQLNFKNITTTKIRAW